MANESKPKEFQLPEKFIDEARQAIAQRRKPTSPSCPVCSKKMEFIQSSQGYHEFYCMEDGVSAPLYKREQKPFDPYAKLMEKNSFN